MSAPQRVARLVCLGLAGAAATAAVPSKVVPTPNGLWPEECVHAVPSGARIQTTADGGVRCLHPNGTEELHAPCKAAARGPRDGVVGDVANATLRSGLGHAYPVAMWGSSIDNLQKWTASYNVPPSPSSDEGQTLYWWIGVEPNSYSIVLQPVLAYMSGEWSFASWNCCPSGHQFQASPISVSPGDNLYGSMTNTGGTSFEIVSQNGGEQSVLNCDDQVAFTEPLISLETYGWNNNCNLLPTGCLTLSNMEIEPYTSFAQRSIDMCSWSLRNEGSTVSICPPEMSESLVTV
jgi:hypothetical protein